MFRTLLASLASIAAAAAAFGADLHTTPEFVAARQALADGLPGVAAVKAERLLKLKGWTRTEMRSLATFAAEAWTRAQSGAAVLALADTYELEDRAFWLAQGLTLVGDLPAARKVLTDNAQAPREPRSALLLAQILTATGETAAARAEIGSLTSAPDPQLQRQARLLLDEISLDEGQSLPTVTALPVHDGAAHYLRARSLLLSGQINAAEAALQQVLNCKSSGERTRHAAFLLQAEILLQRKRPDAAQKHLLKFLDSTSESTVWTQAFDLLDRTHDALPTPRVLPEMVLRWIASGNTAQQQPEPSPALVRAAADFSGHAMYLVARWLNAEKREAEAVGLVEALLQGHPGHPRLADAMHLAMELHTRQGADDRALALAAVAHEHFGESSAAVDSAMGGIFYRRGEHWQALQSFQNAANLATTLTERRRALFNAGLTAVLAGNVSLYHALLSQLEVVAGSAAAGKEGEDSAASLQLEKALFLASQRKPETEETLRTFIREHPEHARLADAYVALAEWMLMSTPPRVEDARTTLQAATAAHLTAEQQQRVDCTMLWLWETTHELKTVVTEGGAFLKKWPKSSQAAEVRFRVASAQYHLEDFASARTEFEIIARDYPDTPHAETALYFAAMSASSVMSTEGRERALTIWEDLAAKGGALAVAARRQQAQSERAQGHLGEALAALDKLLALKALDAEQRRMTICEKAEVLLLMGKTEPARLTAAAALLDEFLADSSLPIFWKARAGFTLATVHHDAGNDTEALEACYNVLRAADVSPPSNPADYVWFAKAGFFGIDLLEVARQWEPAARLAEQIAQRSGNRAVEARDRATKIRLEHFLWDGPPPTPPKEVKLDDKGEPPATGKAATKSSAKN